MLTCCAERGLSGLEKLSRRVVPLSLLGLHGLDQGAKLAPKRYRLAESGEFPVQPVHVRPEPFQLGSALFRSHSGRFLLHPEHVPGGQETPGGWWWNAGTGWLSSYLATPNTGT